MLEIERKFVVPLRCHAMFKDAPGEEFIQAYLTPDVRIRVGKGPPCITVKGVGGIVRPEWEATFSRGREDTLKMIEDFQIPHFRKVRVQAGSGWVVDIIRVNTTTAHRPPLMWLDLVLAEYEAPDLATVENVVLPEWVGREVTGDPLYRNSAFVTEAGRDLAWRRSYRG
jgi:adenylate cyclase